MTREEAITLMKSAQLMLVNPKTNEPISDLYAALDMAIQALESQPRFLVHSDGKIEQIIEPCDDCVSRQSILDEIHKAQDSLKSDNDIVWERNKGNFKGLAWANRIILDAPPVLPKRERSDKE